MINSYFPYLFILSIFLFSCSKNQESKFIKYSEIGDTKIKDKNKNKQDSTGNYEMDITLNTKYLELDIDTIIKIKEPEFMDRFKNYKAEKFLLLRNKDSIYFKTWYYDDSSSALNAFYNLLDCFGKNCIPIELYSNTYRDQHYHLIFISDHAIFWIKANENQKINIWEHFVKEEFSIREYRYVTEQKSNENINWLEQNFRTNTLNYINLE
tara:strand:+ start:428 stop:1057 length:630 start_codon:yes stop_codon:yes gene_type:complete